jgi:hypothetical protein
LQFYYYHIYGVYFKSEFKVDAFHQVDDRDFRKPFVSLSYASIDFDGYTFKDDFVIRAHTSEGFLYVIKNKVAFLVMEDAIYVDPLCENHNEWQGFLTGGGLSILLIQKGFFLLHGSAVKLNHQAYLFTGPSGMGKSSIAIGLNQRGYPLITDDVSSIQSLEDDLIINQGSKQLRLVNDAVKYFNIQNATPLNQPRKQPKFAYQADNSAINQKVKIKAVIEIVDDSTISEMVLSRLDSFEKLKVVKENIYKEELTQIVGVGESYFKCMTELSNEVYFMRLTRNKQKTSLVEMIDFIEDSMLTRF